MSIKNKWVFTCLQIISWIIFVGVTIEAAALLVNFVFSLFKPEMVGRLYEKLDLSAVYAQSKWSYFQLYSLVLFIAFLKAMLFYQVIKLVTKFDWSKPFSNAVSQRITKISHYTWLVGLASFVARATTKRLDHLDYNLDQLDRFWEDTGAFLTMGAVVYVIAIIFAKGVELQTENDLTV